MTIARILEATRPAKRGVAPFRARRRSRVARCAQPRASWPSCARASLISCFLPHPLDVRGDVPAPPTIILDATTTSNVSWGSLLRATRWRRFCRAWTSRWPERGGSLEVTAPSRRLDIREGARGRADVIEEVARVYSYRRIPLHYPGLARAGWAHRTPGTAPPTARHRRGRRPVRGVDAVAGQRSGLRSATPRALARANHQSALVRRVGAARDDAHRPGSRVGEELRTRYRRRRAG